MVFAIWNSVVTDDAGNVVSGANVTVRNTDTGALARLYTNRDGSTPKGNPFYTDANGQISFFAPAGAYTVTAESGPLVRSWQYVPVGTAQEYDIDGLAQFLNSGVVYFQTKADMEAFTPLQFPAAAGVLNDPVATNNGRYTNGGAGWVYAAPFPDTFARLNVTGGDANNPVAALSAGVNPASPLVLYVDVSAPNTGPVTLNVTGLGSGVVRNVNGDLLTAGEWSGRVMLTRQSDGSYKLMNDPEAAAAAALAVTQAGAARDAAVVAKNEAETAKSAAETARTQAGNSATAAAGSASAASGSATDAGNSATAAAGSASTASTKAGEAAASASSASTSAGTATTKAGEASISATNAANSASAASGSATTATTQANRAEDEADRAEAAAAAADATTAIRYVSQTLTTAQKTQARTNIGAISAAEVPAPPVTSVNTKTGAVVLSAGDVGALPSGGKAADSSLLNGQAAAQLPVSTATQTALDGKAGYSTSTDIDEVNFPVGSRLPARSSGAATGDVRDRRQPYTVRIHSNTGEYASFGSGAVLTGVWVAAGYSGIAGNGAYIYDYERIS